MITHGYIFKGGISDAGFSFSPYKSIFGVIDAVWIKLLKIWLIKPQALNN